MLYRTYNKYYNNTGLGGDPIREFEARERTVIARWLFLDFDGVLHPGLAGTFIHLPLLQQFLQDHPDVGVVLTTSWRLDYSLEELRRYFVADLRARVVDVTPALLEYTPAKRYAEIQVWLRRHGACRPWAALDDDASLYPPECPQLVLCNAARGLRQPQLDALRVKLGLS